MTQIMFRIWPYYCLGTLGWIRLPVLGEEKFTLHYSNPDDFQQSRSAGDLRPIEINSNQSPAEFCVYGFEAGSFRRHIRLCDIHGDVIEDILLLLDIDPVRISRSFDITLGGIPSTRKIEVANPYSEERTFYLHTRNVFKRTESKVDSPLAEGTTHFRKMTEFGFMPSSVGRSIFWTVYFGTIYQYGKAR